jgi:starch-binding outer membrane protein SusE/F
MKNWLNRLLLISIASAALVSCKKDETKVRVNVGAASALTVTPATVVLDSSAANRNNTAVTFSWTPADFGFQAGVNYTLQIAKSGTNFANAQGVSLNGLFQQKYTHAELNTIALIAGLTPGSAGQLQARVRSTISSKVDTTYSNVVTVTVTPYLVIINYPSIYVPGDYQGWNPATAPKLGSKFSNNQYEGFVNIPGGTLQFKFTSDPDWNHTNYGWASSTINGNSVTGTLSTSGSAGNLFVPSAGYYRMQANTTALTWNVLKTTWAVIGSAPTASNNWSNDVPMTYNAGTGLWTVTTNCVVGEFKFRANSDWSINLGDDGANLSLEYNGANIAVGTAGSRTITLDLRIPGNYTYTIQ